MSGFNNLMMKSSWGPNKNTSPVVKKNDRIFYVCSYGGSGSYMLMRSLQRYGKVHHIHSRIPPKKLQYIGNEKGGNTYHEWFNGIEIPEDKINNYSIIFIYRNPINVIYSRNNLFSDKRHLKHIQCDENIKLSEVIEEKKDLYKLEEFFDNYTTNNINKNYKIICVKYDDIFCKQHDLSNMLNIGTLNLVNTGKEKIYPNKEELQEIYSSLINKIESFDSIQII